MLPDDKLGIDGFRDVLIENLPCHMVRGVERVGACLSGASGVPVWSMGDRCWKSQT